MLKGLGDLGNLLKMQKEMKNIQKRIKKARIEGGSPGGEVTAAMDGEFSLLEIKISPDLVAGSNTALIEKLVKAAIDDTHSRVKSHSAAEVEKITREMNLPDFLFK